MEQSKESVVDVGESAEGVLVGSERIEPSECVLERVDFHVDGNYPLKQVVLPDGSTVITSDSPENFASVWNACFAGPGLMPDEQQALFLSSQVFEGGEGIIVEPDAPAIYRRAEVFEFEYVPPSVEFTDDGYVARYFLFQLYGPQLSWVEQHVTDAEISTTYQSMPLQ